MLLNTYIYPPTNRALLIDNVTCPYCAVELVRNNVTKEHVIGRRFVPKGALNGRWNLIMKACKNCNSVKADLEDDISAITLAGRAWFDSGAFCESILSEARRKSENSVSRMTRKPVKHSEGGVNFEVPFGRGATLSVSCVSPPQVDTFRLFELARMQIMAVFYFITFNRETKKGGFWLNGFHPHSEAHHSDWGNALQIAFMHAVVAWEPRWIGITADGFFKSIIRRHPHEECWSWALEWNKNYRLIGFFGNREPAQALVNTFPVVEMTDIPTRDESTLRVREDIKLAEEDDVLFVRDGWKPKAENGLRKTSF